ncbi:hypothetical protein NGTWS0302_00110 [Mycolicibacterium cyprinidarum]|nr:hypothetical protein NGTWS0302_00110 [Mycolicibacterium sp. NGTWS0302]
MPARKNRPAQSLLQRRHAGTGLDYESYARWLRVSTVVVGLGVAIATGSGVAAASPGDSDRASGVSSSQATQGASDDRDESSTAGNQDSQSDEGNSDVGDDNGITDSLDADDDEADDTETGDIGNLVEQDVQDEQAEADEGAEVAEGPDDQVVDPDEVGSATDSETLEESPVLELPAAEGTERANRSSTDTSIDTGGVDGPEIDALAESPVTVEVVPSSTSTAATTLSSVSTNAHQPSSTNTQRAVVEVSAAVPATAEMTKGRQQEAVTVNSIVTDILHWAGLGSQATDLPVPAIPVPLLVQSLWLFVRDVQYTWNNQRPVVGPTISGRAPDGTITGNLNAVDYDDSNLTYIVAAQPGHGTVTIDEDGNFTYTPNTGTAAATDTFTITVDDTVGNPKHFYGLLGMVGAVGPRQATVSVSLDGSDLPTEGRQSEAVNLKSIVTDVLHWVGLSGLANRLSIPETAVSPGTESWWRFVRELAYHNDNQRATASPSIEGQAPDGTVTGNLNAVDYDDTTLSYTVTDAPKNGSVTVDANGNFAFTPDTLTAAAGGTATFTVTINDTIGTPTHYRGILGRLGILGPRRVTVAVSVKPIGPQVIGDGYSIGDTELETGAVTGAAALTNVGTEPLTYSAAPTSKWGGTVVIGDDGQFTYVPSEEARHAAAADGAGPDQLTDTFDVTVTDGFGGVTTLAVTVNIEPSNTNPAVETTAGNPDDTGTVTGTIDVTDPDGDAPTVTVPATTTNGATITFDPATGEYTYTPTEEARHAAAADGAGPDQLTDTFDITVTDGFGGVTTLAVTVNIEPTNTPPAIETTAGNPDDTGTVTGTIDVTDPDGDTPTVTVPATTTNGATITFDPATGQYTYTPTEEARHAAAADGAGPDQLTDTFDITIDDGHGSTTTVAVTVNIEPTNTAPNSIVATADSPDPLTGTVTGTIGNDLNNDGILDGVPTDPDGDTLTYTVPATTTNGATITFNPATGQYTYTPTEEARHAAAADGAGPDQLTDTFDITIDDGHGSTTTVAVTVTIEPTNTAPNSIVATADSPDPLTGTVTGTIGNDLNNDGILDGVPTDPDGDTLTYTVPATTTNGATITVNPATGEYTYVPSVASRDAAAAEDAGPDQLTDTFDITVTDGHGGAATVAVTVNIEPTNTPPTVSSTVDSPDETGIVTGTIDVTDPDGDTPTVTVPASTDKGGTISFDPAVGEFIYVPSVASRDAAAAEDAGPDQLTDTFDITVDDGRGGITTVSVTVDIDPRSNAAPGPLSLAFSGTDEDLITYLREYQPAAPENPAGARDVVSGGELFLGGNYIEIGLSPKGSFGTVSDAPDGFFGTAGSDKVGLSNDVDGFGSGVDSRIDFFIPGTPEERWSVGFNDTQYGGFSALASDGGNTRTLSDLSLSDDSLGDTLSGTLVATVGGVLQTVQVHTFRVNDSFFQTIVTLSNVGDETLSNVEFMRSFDPDNTQFKGGSFTTINAVKGQYATEGVAAVTATSLANDAYETLTGQQATILFLSKNPNAVVYTGGFRNSNPYEFDSAEQSAGYTRTADEAIGIVFKGGDLAPGESTTFTYYTALSTDENVSSVVARIDAPTVTEGVPGAQVGMVTASDPDPNDVLTFAVSDARFEVVQSGDTNILKLRDDIALNYSAESTVTLSITATDSVGASTSQAFTINVVEGSVVEL